MKRIKHYLVYFILSMLFIGCSKNNGTDEAAGIEIATNIDQAVQTGQPNCIEAISGKIRLKLSVDSSATSAHSTTVKINAKTDKLYPSGGYILVFDIKTGESY